jgi:hypothetical protein
MRRGARSLVHLGLLVAGSLSCRGRGREVAAGPWLEAHWTGADKGKMAAPASAEWCDTLHLLEIRAVHGDTGLALAIYPFGTIESGTYRVRPPERADSAPPSAAMALRWFGETTIQGFQGQSGEVVLQGSRSVPLSGRFQVRAVAPGSMSRLSVTGSFRDLTVRPSTRGCLPRGTQPLGPPPPDSGVH